MRLIAFLCRLALICNLVFIGCLALRHSNWKVQEDLASMIIIMGWLMAIVINFFVNGIIAIRILVHKPLYISRWLVFTNFIFLLVQLIYLLTQTIL